MTANGSPESNPAPAPIRRQVRSPGTGRGGRGSGGQGGDRGGWWLELRRRAESRLAARAAPSDRPDPEQILGLIDDLQAYQVELELQNEELRAARDRLEASHAALARTRNRLSEESTGALLDRLSIPIAVLDAQGRILAGNRAWTDLAGSDGRWTGRDYREAAASLFDLEPDAADRLKKALAGFQAGEEGEHTLQARLRGPAEGFQLRIASGAGSSRIVVAHEDIGPRLRIERALMAGEACFCRTVENLPTGICELDRDLEFWGLNPAARNLLSLPGERGLPAPKFTDLIAPADLPVLLDWLRQGPGPREDFLGELSLRPLAGAEIQVLAHIAEIPGPTGPVGYRCCLTDLTWQREAARNLGEAEARLQQAQKMEAVGRLAGGVAHDFNNILTVLQGYAQLLLEEFAATPEAQRMLAEILENARRAASLTEQLLAFSRNQVLDPRRLDLTRVVGETERLLQRLIGEDLKLVLELEPGIWPVRADPGQLTQVLLNLAVNARDAMTYGGVLTIRTRNRTFSPGPGCREGLAPAGPGAGDFVELTVQDTGAGIPAEIRQHIFEPFFTTKEPGKGTGLGLATVYGIVKQSGGFIDVESDPGRGTEFRIFLPRDRGAEPAAAPQAVPRTEPATPATILLAEDDPSVRQLTAHLLSQAGYRVLEARDGIHALELARSHRGSIDLFLSDVVMPGPSGPETHRRLASRVRGLQALYMSGYTPEQIMQHGVLRPGVNLIQKPFSPESLLAAVAGALGMKGPGQEGSAEAELPI